MLLASVDWIRGRPLVPNYNACDGFCGRKGNDGGGIHFPERKF